MNKVTIFLIALMLSFISAGLYGQSEISVASGFWHDPATWQSGAVPGVASGIVQIAPGHVVVVQDFREADEVVVSGTLSISPSGRLHVRNGPGVDLLVSGYLDVSGVLEGGDRSEIQSATGLALFRKGGVYRSLHAAAEGSIPLATWHSESTVEVTGYTTANVATEAGHWGQVFGNMVWNAGAQQSVFNFNGLLKRLQGNLLVYSTGSRGLLFSGRTGQEELVVDGDLVISGDSRVELTNAALGRFTLSIGRNFVLDTSGSMSFASEGYGVLAVGRDVVIRRGMISESGAATGVFLFAGSRRHRFDRDVSGEAGVFSGRINYTVAAADTLDLGNAVLGYGAGNANANTLRVEGTLILGSGDPLGAFQNTTTGGNIRTAVSYRSFAAGSRVIYRGRARQFMADAGVASARGTSTYIDNPAGVTVSSAVKIPGDVVLLQGALSIGDGAVLTLGGRISAEKGFLEGKPAASLIIADSTGASCSLPLNPSSATLGTLTVERKVPAALSLSGTLVVTKALNLVSGELVNEDELVLASGAVVTRWPAGRLAGKPARMPAGGYYTACYRSQALPAGSRSKIVCGLELKTVDAALSVLRIQMAQLADTVALVQDIAVHDQLQLERGVLYVSGQTIRFGGSTWSDGTGNFGYGKGAVEFSDSTWVRGSTNSKFYDLTVLPGAKVYFERNTTIFHDLEFRPGSYVALGDRTVTLGGESAQRISASGAFFGGLTVAKPAGGVELQSLLNLRGVLRFNSPSRGIVLNSNGFLNLISETDSVAVLGNGMIYRLQDGNTVSGSVTVQRFMRGEGRVYRYIASPVADATVASWKDDFVITGDFADPSAAGIICGSKVQRKTPSLFYYDERTAGYVAYPLPSRLSTDSPLAAGRGYSAFIRECALPTRVDVAGVINQQQVSLPVTFTPGSAFSGWNLVGNPYPCTIDWDLTADGWRKTNISPVIAIPDNGYGGGFFRYWDGDEEPSGIAGGRIATGQAFWVRATGANPVLAVREGVKVAQPAEFFRESPNPVQASLAIHLSHASGVDHAFVKIKTGARTGLDSLDAPKLNNAKFDLATLSKDSLAMAINALDRLACEDSLELSVTDCTAGAYSFQIDARGELGSYAIVLKDRLLKREATMGGQSAYSFQLPDDAQDMRGRFVLIWKFLAPASAAELISRQDTLYDGQSAMLEVRGPVRGESYSVWEGGTAVSTTLKVMADDLGEGGHELKVRRQGDCFSEIIPGSVWMQRLKGPEGIVSVSPGEDAPPARLLVYPNPVGDYLVLSGDFDLPEEIQWVDLLGRVVSLRPAIRPGGSQKISIFDVNNLRAGFYLLRFRDKNGVVHAVSIVKK